MDPWIMRPVCKPLRHSVNSFLSHHVVRPLFFFCLLQKKMNFWQGRWDWGTNFTCHLQQKNLKQDRRIYCRTFRLLSLLYKILSGASRYKMESYNWNIDPAENVVFESLFSYIYTPISEIPSMNAIPLNFSHTSTKHIYNPFTMTYTSRRKFIEKSWQEQDIDCLEDIYREELKNLTCACVMVPFGDWAVKEPWIEDFKPFMHYFFTKNYFGSMVTTNEIKLLQCAMYCALTSFSIPLIFLCLFYMRWYIIVQICRRRGLAKSVTWSMCQNIKWGSTV